MWNMVGSKWFKVDFHCHSPASDDFQRNCPLPKSSYRDWLLGQMSNELDCVVLSDHNTSGGLDPIRNELQLLKDDFLINPNNGYRPLIIIPAVELTAADSTHVLAIFREDTLSTTIERFIGQLITPSGQHNHQLVLGTGTNAIIKAAKNSSEDILIILAHVDQPKGVFKNVNQSAVVEIFKEGPDAVELINDVTELSSSYQCNLIKNLSHVKGSDAHSIKEMGRNYTWVKMIEPTFDGIKSALSEPAHCILRSPAQPPSITPDQITKLSVKSILCKTDTEKAIDLNFSPWYTSIIGGRGSGKSTLVEALRFALRRDTDRYVPKDQLTMISTLKDKAFDDSSFVNVEYRKSNELYRLTWSKTNTSLYHLNDSGSWDLEDTFSPDRFSISIYSQKMLYEIATKNDAFLSVIDASNIVNRDQWDNDRLVLEEYYKRYCSDYRIVAQKLENLSVIKGQYDDVQRKLSLLKNAGLQPLQDALANFNVEEQSATLALEALELTLNNLKEVALNHSLIKLPEITASSYCWFTNIDKIQNDLLSDIEDKVNSYQEKIEELKRNQYITELLINLEATNSELKRKVDELSQIQISPKELTTLLASEITLRNELAGREDLVIQLATIDDNINLAYKNLVKHRKLLTQSRIDFINSLNLEDLNVKILPLASEANSVLSSYQKLSGIERFTQNIYDELNKNTLLHTFMNIHRFKPNAGDLRYAEVAKIKTYHNNVLTKTDNPNFTSLHGGLKRRISEISTENATNFMCWFPEDGLNIEFRDEEQQFRQLETASPGQKSASMLSFLMSYGTDPLVLDQPEDDLDCGMLLTSVIPAIVNNKVRRQLIIVSHSAPIIVNGDTELVIAMKQRSRRLQPILIGGLQEKSIKDFICTQMEGGERAFKARYNRILG